MDDYTKANLDWWNEAATIHSQGEGYDLASFKAGKNKLHPLELEEVGDVAGKKLLHLQCHFGLDTLSWARLGAQVTGIDFSDKAIAIAQNLSRNLTWTQPSYTPNCINCQMFLMPLENLISFSHHMALLAGCPICNPGATLLGTISNREASSISQKAIPSCGHSMKNLSILNSVTPTFQKNQSRTRRRARMPRRMPSSNILPPMGGITPSARSSIR